MTQIIALVVHTEEHIIVLSIESLVALRTFQSSEVVLLLLLLLNPDEVEADLLTCQLLTASLAFHDLDVEHLIAIATVIAIAATAVGVSLAPLSRPNNLVIIVVAVISSCSSKHIVLLLLTITRSSVIRLLVASWRTLTIDGSEALIAHDHLLFVSSAAGFILSSAAPLALDLSRCADVGQCWSVMEVQRVESRWLLGCAIVAEFRACCCLVVLRSTLAWLLVGRGQEASGNALVLRLTVHFKWMEGWSWLKKKVRQKNNYKWLRLIHIYKLCPNRGAHINFI